MEIIQSDIPEVFQLRPKVFGDERGFFVETYMSDSYKKLGINYDFVQDNHSRSSFGVLRGLHYQLRHPQGKLVRVVSGVVFDVAVDIRKNSPTFGKSVSAILTSGMKNQFWVPPGFAHGFCVLSEHADFEYKCTNYYDPNDEYSIQWNDPALQIAWPINEPKLSVKDNVAPLLSDVPLNHLPLFTN